MKNKSGFSIVEMMISVSVMGIMITYMMQIQTNNQRQFRLMSEQIDEMTFLNRVRQLFESENTCTATLGAYCAKSSPRDDSYVFHRINCESPRYWAVNNYVGMYPELWEKRDLYSLEHGKRSDPYETKASVTRGIFNKDKQVVMRLCRNPLDARSLVGRNSPVMLEKLAIEFEKRLKVDKGFCQEGRFGDSIYLHRIIPIRDPNLKNSGELQKTGEFERGGEKYEEWQSINPDIGQIHVVVEYFQKSVDKKAYGVRGAMKRSIITLNAQTWFNAPNDLSSNIRISRCGAGVHTFEQPRPTLVRPPGTPDTTNNTPVLSTVDEPSKDSAEDGYTRFCQGDSECIKTCTTNPDLPECMTNNEIGAYVEKACSGDPDCTKLCTEDLYSTKCEPILAVVREIRDSSSGSDSLVGSDSSSGSDSTYNDVCGGDQYCIDKCTKYPNEAGCVPDKLIDPAIVEACGGDTYCEDLCSSDPKNPKCEFIYAESPSTGSPSTGSKEIDPVIVKACGGDTYCEDLCSSDPKNPKCAFIYDESPSYAVGEEKPDFSGDSSDGSLDFTTGGETPVKDSSILSNSKEPSKEPASTDSKEPISMVDGKTPSSGSEKPISTGSDSGGSGTTFGGGGTTFGGGGTTFGGGATELDVTADPEILDLNTDEVTNELNKQIIDDSGVKVPSI